MADIKTRDAVKGTIKTLDKAAIAGERMKSAYAKTKDKAEQGYYAEENSPTEYASDKVSHASGRIKDEGIHQFNKQGQRSVTTTKENIGRAKDKIAEFKTKRAVKAAEQKKAQAVAEQNGLADPKRGSEPFSCHRCSQAGRNAPDPDRGKPVDKDKAAGEKDHQDHSQKCRKNHQDHSQRDGQGNGKRRENRRGDIQDSD